MRVSGARDGATRPDADAAERLAPADLLQPLIGLAMGARVCRHMLEADAPDMDAVRALLSEMVDVAEDAVVRIRR
jgi:hypothetical protein